MLRKAMIDAETMLKELCDFCLRGGGRKLFAGWDGDILRQWLVWHAHNGSLIVVRSPRGQIVGLGAGRRAMEPDIDTHWHYDPAGDSFYIEKVVVTRPGVLQVVVTEFQKRFKDWQRLKLFAHRLRGIDPHRQLVRYSEQFVQRLLSLETL